MAQFTISEVLQAVNGNLLTAGEKDIIFTGVSTDTRTLKRGELFIALAGENFDAHNFLMQAVEKGAAGVVVSRTDAALDENTPVILVADTKKALQDLAHFHRMRFNIPVIAVTGSNGKTTTKDMIASVLSTAFSVLKTEGNYNNEIGLPLTLLKLNSYHQAAVVEMGMRGKGEIAELAGIAKPTIGVITNVGQTHIELLGTVENIAEAKGELIESLGIDGLAILNMDNDYVSNIISRKGQCPIWFYGINKPCDFRAGQVRLYPDRIEYVCVVSTGEMIDIRMPIVGLHNVYNSLAAVAVGKALGLTIQQIANGLSRIELTGMRLEIQEMGGVKLINDAYNASPLSMNAAIDTLQQVALERSVAVLGDMLELGDYALEAHYDVGKKLAVNKVDVVITVGQLSRHIAKGARDNGVPVVVECANHNEAIEAMKQEIKIGDTVLVKGSRGMEMEKVLGGLPCSK